MADYEILNIKTNGFEMECVHFGKGTQPFVIIPGISMEPIVNSADAVAKGFEQFRDNYDVYLIDRRKEMPENYTVFQMAEDTAEVMKKLNLKSSCIFGASQGGMIAQYLAINHPHLVKKLVLGSTASRLNPSAEKSLVYWVKLAEEKDYIKINHSMLFDLFSQPFVEKYKEIFSTMAQKDNSQYCHRFEIQTKACYGLNTYDDLEKITCPVLVIGAEKDRILSVKSSVEIAQKLNCQIYIYKDYGHAVYDEAPDYIERLKNFFEN